MMKDIILPARTRGRGSSGAWAWPTGRRVRSWATRIWATGTATFLLATGLAALATAQAASFKQAPQVAEAADDGPDTILGLIHINTAFFIVVGVIGFFWFIFGGGRKANIGRKE